MQIRLCMGLSLTCSADTDTRGNRCVYITGHEHQVPTNCTGLNLLHEISSCTHSSTAANLYNYYLMIFYLLPGSSSGRCPRMVGSDLVAPSSSVVGGAEEHLDDVGGEDLEDAGVIGPSDTPRRLELADGGAEGEVVAEHLLEGSPLQHPELQRANAAGLP